MKKLILVGLSLIASLTTLDVGGSALAAEVAVEPIYPSYGYPSYGVPVSVAYNWTGFYIGANVGGHFPKDEIGTTSFGFPGAAVIDATSGTSLTPSAGWRGSVATRRSAMARRL